MSEIKAFFIRLVILLIFLWLLFGVFFGITPMRGNDMFPRISAGDLLLYYRLEKNFNSGDVLVFRKPYDKKKVNCPLSLKKDEVFLLCDYREGGRDSRYFGAVSKKEIKGKVITILRRSDL